MISLRVRFIAGSLMLILASTASSQSWLEKLNREAKRINDQLDGLTAETTAGSTPATDPRIQLNAETQNCNGRWGFDCDGFMTDMRNPAKVEFPCEGEDKLVCITSGMTMGSIKHDMCCDAERAKGVTGHWCGGNLASRGMAACEAEWDQAKLDWQANKMFSYTWRYQIGSNPTTDSHNWWFGLAPAGIEVNQSDPQVDRALCHSNNVVLDGRKWVCGPANSQTEEVTAVTGQIPNSRYSLYGLEIGMSYDRALGALKARYPNMDITSNGTVFWGLGGPKPSSVISKDSYHIPKKGIAAIRLTQCAEDQIAENRQEKCVARLAFAARLGDGEYHKVDLSFAENYPERPGESILYNMIFSHELGNRKPFEARQFVEEKYGPTEDTTGWNTYRVFFNSAIGEARISLSGGASAKDKYLPRKQYSITMVSVTDSDRSSGIGDQGRGALGKKLADLKKIVREEKAKRNEPATEADDPF